jgi:hypothetical protein
MLTNDRIGVMPDLRAIIHRLTAPTRRPEDLLVGILLVASRRAVPAGGGYRVAGSHQFRRAVRTLARARILLKSAI